MALAHKESSRQEKVLEAEDPAINPVVHAFWKLNPPGNAVDI